MYKHILVPVELGHGDVAERILLVAKELLAPGGKISLLTVLEPVPSFVANYIPEDTNAKIRKDAHEKLDALKRSTGVEGEVHLRTGSAANAIIEEAEKLGCDAIILGSHRPDYRTYFIGSTAARVVRHAQCTVIVERSAPI
jgi:universal stress protein F